MADIISTISRLVQDHDKDTSRVGNELRSLSPSEIPQESIFSYSWLLNHVLGQLQGAWNDSYVRHKALSSSDAHPVISRNYAVAAFYAGHPFDAWCAQDAYKKGAEIPDAQADVIMRLSVLQYASDMSTAEFSDVLHSAVASTESWTGSTPGVKAVAAALNNTVSIWLEKEVVPGAPINSVMSEAAHRSQKLWEASGTWINNERGWYLCVLVSSHLSRWTDARDAALTGISIIDANGEEDVDRAFFLLELARAYKGLSQISEQKKAYESALAIAKTNAFDEPGLRQDFDKKAGGLDT